MSSIKCTSALCSSLAFAKCLNCDCILCDIHLKRHPCAAASEERRPATQKIICDSHESQYVLIGCRECLKAFCADCLHGSSCTGSATLGSADMVNSHACGSSVAHQYVTLTTLQSICEEKVQLRVNQVKRQYLKSNRDLKLLKSNSEVMLQMGHDQLKKARDELSRRIEVIKTINEGEIEKFESHLKSVGVRGTHLITQMELQIAELRNTMSRQQIVNENPVKMREFLFMNTEPSLDNVTPTWNGLITEGSLTISEEEPALFIKATITERKKDVDRLDGNAKLVVDVPKKNKPAPSPQSLLNGLSQKGQPQKYTRAFLLSLCNHSLSRRRPTILIEDGFRVSDVPLYKDRGVTVDANRSGVPEFPPDFFRKPFTPK